MDFFFVPIESSTDIDSTEPLPPVLLQHGLVDSPSTFMVNTETNDKGTELSLGLYLAANGFDVWIGGSRGVEPTAHVKYNPTDSEFWKWSYDEMALFDVPAYIRYISRTNGGDQKLKYIGHSQGTVIAFALFSSCHTSWLVQDVCRMVDLAVLLAPIPYSSSTPSQSPDAVINQWQSIVKTNADIASADTDTDTATAIQSSVGPKPTQTNSQSVGVQLPLQDESIRYDIIRDGLYAICNNTLTEICYEVICVTFGCLSRKNYSPQSAGNIFGHYPQPSSEQNNKHWDQFKGPLMKFDFGTSELNTEKYGQATPPIYDLSKLSVNVALFYGSDDPTAQSLINGGPNLLPAHRVVFQRNVTGYGHADFVWVWTLLLMCILTY